MATHELTDPMIDSPFSRAEWEQFQTEDNSAGKTIGKILATLFLYTVLIMSLVSWWTFSVVGSH